MFKTDLMNIAQEKYFYEAVPLNRAEFEFIAKFINSLDKTAHALMWSNFDNYNFCANSSEELLRKEGLEDYHSLIEALGIPIIKKIYKHDLSFFDNEKEKNDFSAFIGFQYSRTKKMRENIKKLFTFQNFTRLVSPEIRPDILANVLNFLFSDIIGNWVSSNAKILLIINQSNSDFITGDQPVINLKATSLESGIPTTSTEIYYPFSPKLAILLSETFTATELIIKDGDNIHYYNNFICDDSVSQVYAANSDCLNAYMKSDITK
ncbi:conserved hypothetical protein [Treponema primitia ZAS-2]|uniref:DUF4238 domain-containing protein n=1 Tax=Treponema primitia (strain ATCC BAA-887 / DSM 12427 / ZAS-2) TaxID=545694 RepID=F5YI50_TREPZ|nr:conserved hypothetical protein [Treponema primitia ZAS-2]